MKTPLNVEPWEAISKRAYWDRDIPLERWQERVAAGHRSYLPGAVSAMTAFEFAHFYGWKKFTRDWPELRARLPEDVAIKAGMYDLAWSRLVGGGWNLRPFPEFSALPQRRRQFLIAVAQSPGRSIYELSKALGIQYRRAHDHAAQLTRDGRIFGKEVVDGGRRKTKLYPR